MKHVIPATLDHGGSDLTAKRAALENEGWRKVLPSINVGLRSGRCARAELVVRAIQRVEERCKWKLAAVDDRGKLPFMGTAGGSRTGPVACKKLTEWVGGEAQQAALATKECRKAREERQLARLCDKGRMQTAS